MTFLIHLFCECIAAWLLAVDVLELFILFAYACAAAAALLPVACKLLPICMVSWLCCNHWFTVLPI